MPYSISRSSTLASAGGFGARFHATSGSQSELGVSATVRPADVTVVTFTGRRGGERFRRLFDAQRRIAVTPRARARVTCGAVSLPDRPDHVRCKFLGALDVVDPARDARKWLRRRQRDLSIGCRYFEG